MQDFIASVAEQLHQELPDNLQWIVPLARHTLEYVLGPFIQDGGRFPWWSIPTTLILVIGIYLSGSGRGQRRSVSDFLRFCFPRENYGCASFWVDIKVGFANVFVQPMVNLTWRIGSALIATKIVSLLVVAFGPAGPPRFWGPFSIFGCAVALSMLSDFGYFLFHWLSHVFPPLWAIHKLHHSPETLTPLTAARVHPLEHAIMGPFMAVTTGILIGPLMYLYGGITNPGTVFGLYLPGAAFFLLGHLLHHSHVWLYFGPVVGRMIVSPAQHQIHHSSLPQHRDRNFAEHWAFWDVLFGTIYLPKGQETLKLGLTGYDTQPHRGLVTAYFGPVLDSIAVSYELARRLMLRLPPVRASDR